VSLSERIAIAQGRRNLTAAAEGMPRRRDSFKGAEVNRLMGDWMKQTRRADDEVKRSLRRMRARARDLSRNSSTMRHFRRYLCSNVIGPQGARLQVLGADKAVAEAIESAWRRFVRSRVTVDGKLSFLACQKLVLKTIATDGEMFVRKYLNFRNEFGFALQLIDADQVDETFNRNPSQGVNEIRLGVEVDTLGRPLAYHIYDERRGPSAMASFAARKRIVAPEVLHLYDPERANQTRGITWFQTSMWPLKQRDALQDAEITAARVSSGKMGFMQQKEGGLAGEFSGNATSTAPTEPELMDAQPGVIDVLPQGYEFAPWDPQHPTTAFAPFLKVIMRDIASGLGANYNALANDYEGVNYSSMRSGLLIERDMWRELQAWWEVEFLLPVYAEWLNMALLTGALKLPSSDYRDYLDVSFEPRGWSWVDPLKEVQAYREAIGIGGMSRKQMALERGDEFEKIAQELADEAAIAKKLGISIEAKSGGSTVDPNEDEDAKDKPSGGGDSNSNGNGDGRHRLAALIRT
jgi:lambda family phage portal protein